MQRLEVSGAVRPMYVSLGVRHFKDCIAKEPSNIWNIYIFLREESYGPAVHVFMSTIRLRPQPF